MSILITGSSGFIGTNFCKYLIKKKKKFIGVDLIKNPYINIKQFYKINLKDICKLEKIFTNHKVKEVIHLAAVSGVNACHNKPQVAFDSNLYSTFNILELSKKYKIKKIILISSFSANNFFVKPSVYGFTKLSTEQIGICYKENFNLPVSIIKLSNIYGPYSLHKESAIHKFIRQNIKKNKITIHDSGNQFRDFVFVLDVVSLIYKLLNQKKINISYNLCTGKNTSILKIKNLIDKISQKHNSYKHIKAPVGYDTSIIKTKKKSDLNFLFTSLENGLIQTYKWYELNFKI